MTNNINGFQVRANALAAQSTAKTTKSAPVKGSGSTESVSSITEQFQNGEINANEAVSKLKKLGATNFKINTTGCGTLTFEYKGKTYEITSNAVAAARGGGVGNTATNSIFTCPPERHVETLTNQTMQLDHEDGFEFGSTREEAISNAQEYHSVDAVGDVLQNHIKELTGSSFGSGGYSMDSGDLIWEDCKVRVDNAVVTNFKIESYTLTQREDGTWKVDFIYSCDVTYDVEITTPWKVGDTWTDEYGQTWRCTQDGGLGWEAVENAEPGIDGIKEPSTNDSKTSIGKFDKSEKYKKGDLDATAKLNQLKSDRIEFSKLNNIASAKTYKKS